MKPPDHQWHNRAAWDRLAETQNRLAKPAQDEDFENPLQFVDAAGWLGTDISGQQVLCLAAGGGRHGPLYAAAGADVTVVDISPNMLAQDESVARKRNLRLRTIEASMDDLKQLTDDQFDIVIHPVSTCYVPDVVPVYRDIARVLRIGGLYVSQHKQPTSLQTTLAPRDGKFHIEHRYYSQSPLPPVSKPNLVREKGTLEFVHRWEQLLGEMCRAGLVIEDLFEPLHAEPEAEQESFEYRCQYVAPYVRVKARRIELPSTIENAKVWVPDC